MKKSIGYQFIFWALIIGACGASAEQHVWSFTLEGGGLGGATEIYASQNFPTDTVPVGETFNVYNMIVSSDTTHDIVPDGIDASGCEIVGTDVFPGTNETNYRTEVITLLMTDEACSIAREVRVFNEAQTTLLYSHNFVFTVESHQHIELGNSDSSGLIGFWVPFVFWAGVLIVALFMDSPWIAGFSLPGLFNIILPDVIPFEQEAYLLFLLVGAIMEYFAHRKRLREGSLTR